MDVLEEKLWTKHKHTHTQTHNMHTSLPHMASNVIRREIVRGRKERHGTGEKKALWYYIFQKHHVLCLLKFSVLTNRTDFLSFLACSYHVCCHFPHSVSFKFSSQDLIKDKMFNYQVFWGDFSFLFTYLFWSLSVTKPTWCTFFILVIHIGVVSTFI